jgi:hypothetical protein
MYGLHVCMHRLTCMDASSISGASIHGNEPLPAPLRLAPTQKEICMHRLTCMDAKQHQRRQHTWQRASPGSPAPTQKEREFESSIPRCPGLALPPSRPNTKRKRETAINPPIKILWPRHSAHPRQLTSPSLAPTSTLAHRLCFAIARRHRRRHLAVPSRRTADCHEELPTSSVFHGRPPC